MQGLASLEQAGRVTAWSRRRRWERVELTVRQQQETGRQSLFVTLWTVARQAPLSMGILQARILAGVATPFSRGPSWPRDQTWSPALQAG